MILLNEVQVDEDSKAQLSLLYEEAINNTVSVEALTDNPILYMIIGKFEEIKVNTANTSQTDKLWIHVTLMRDEGICMCRTLW